MIPLFKVHMPDSVDEPLLQTLHSGFLSQGPRVKEFEDRLVEYFGAHVLALNSATSAIALALRLCGVGPGNEVISTPMTCAATNEPILAAGARPVWADVDPNTGLIDPASAEQAITPRTKAIIVVHWGGTPADLAQFADIGRRHGLPIIEDAAHALGARVFTETGWVPLGGHLADFSCFSLQAIKHITTGDGGLLVTPHTEAWSRGAKLRWFGIDREASHDDERIEQDIEEWGYKFHMNDLAATIGIEQFRHLGWIVARHRGNAAVYDRELPPHFVRAAAGRVDSAYWLYTVLLPDSQTRDEFRRYMAGKGIQVSRVHARNDLFTAFRASRKELPGVDAFDSRMICLPVHWGIAEPEFDTILAACRDFAGVPC